MNIQYNECMICLESIRNTSSKMLSCNCKVVIHDECHKKWNEQHNSECPMCRKICSTLTIKVPVIENAVYQDHQTYQETCHNRINNIKQYTFGAMIVIILILVIAVAVIL